MYNLRKDCKKNVQTGSGSGLTSGNGSGSGGMGSATGTKPKSILKNSPGPSPAVTRSRTSHYVFGKARSMPENQLPTSVDVKRHYDWLKIQNSRGTPSSFFKDISIELQRIWAKNSIPTNDYDSIYVKVYRFFTQNSKLETIRKSEHKSMENKDKWIQDRFDEFNVLFNISSCTCFDKCRDNFNVFFNSKMCKCDKKIKTANDLEYYIDQMTTRKLFNGPKIDKKVSSEMKIQNEREQRKLDKMEKNRIEAEKVQKKIEIDKLSMTPSYSAAVEDLDDFNILDSEVIDPDFDSNTEPQQRSRCTVDYPRSIAFAARCDASITMTDIFIASVIKDVKEAEAKAGRSLSVEELIISRTKVASDLEKARKQAIQKNDENKSLVCIKFDGRGDGQTNIGLNRKGMEKHITIISEPNSKYLDFITLSKGESEDAQRLATEIFSIICQYHSRNTIRVIGCDGENKNTGRRENGGGALKLLENHMIRRPFHWAVCMLHLNELWMTKLFKEYDGGTFAPAGYRGAIGKTFNKLELKPPIKFEKIDGWVTQPDQSILQDMNNDQKLLIKMCLAVQSGVYDPKLMTVKMPQVHQARWLNMNISILRLYVQTPKPSQTLIRLVQITLNLYVPFFTMIKKNWRLQDGAKNIFEMIKSARSFLNQREFKLFKESISRNGYMAHPEIIHLAALYDKDLKVRKKVVNRIILDRGIRLKPDSIMRSYQLSPINFEAQSYFTLVDYNLVSDKSYFTEPPLTFDFSIEQLEKCANGEDLILPDIPCHSQANERAVGQTTIAVEKYETYEKRHANLLQKQEHRAMLPSKATKKDKENI